jgi:hypothetical protein
MTRLRLKYIVKGIFLLARHDELELGLSSSFSSWSLSTVGGRANVCTGARGDCRQRSLTDLAIAEVIPRATDCP